jgi:hypothetical protein
MILGNAICGKETFKQLLYRHDSRIGLDVRITDSVYLRLLTVATNQLELFARG